MPTMVASREQQVEEEEHSSNNPVPVVVVAVAAVVQCLVDLEAPNLRFAYLLSIGARMA